MQRALRSTPIPPEEPLRPSPTGSRPESAPLKRPEPHPAQHMVVFSRRVCDKAPLGCLTLQAPRLCRAVSFSVASWARRFAPAAVSLNAVKRPRREATEVQVSLPVEIFRRTDELLMSYRNPVWLE